MMSIYGVLRLGSWGIKVGTLIQVSILSKVTFFFDGREIGFGVIEGTIHSKGFDEKGRNFNGSDLLDRTVDCISSGIYARRRGWYVRVHIMYKEARNRK